MNAADRRARPFPAVARSHSIGQRPYGDGSGRLTRLHVPSDPNHA
jgi:hypothetical protein